MEQESPLECPTDVLIRILHELALDGASLAWQRLAYLTCKNQDLINTAKEMKRPMVLRIATESVSKDQFSFTFVIPFRQADVQDIEVDWGDGKRESFDSACPEPWAWHDYSSAGEYTVRVFPRGPGKDGVWLSHLGWIMTDFWENRPMIPMFWSRLKSFHSLGSLGIRSMDLLFMEATEFNIPLCNLDVSTVQSMMRLFGGASRFNQPIENWNVSNVKNMFRMFSGASSFNQPLGRWVTKQVESMELMFANAQSFNQPIGTWDVSSVTSIENMFSGANQFTQDISCWNLAKKPRAPPNGTTRSE